MFEIKPRVYDLQVSADKMERLRWGLFRDAIYQAEQFIKYNTNYSKSDIDEFMRKTTSIEMHEWINTVLDYGHMHEHERLLREIKTIIGGNIK